MGRRESIAMAYDARRLSQVPRMTFSVNVCTASGHILRLSGLRPRDTILYLKTLICWYWGRLEDGQRLVYTKRFLADDKTVAYSCQALADDKTLAESGLFPEVWIDLERC